MEFAKTLEFRTCVIVNKVIIWKTNVVLERYLYTRNVKLSQTEYLLHHNYILV